MYDSLFSESFFRLQGKWTVRSIKEKKLSPEQIWSYMELSNTSVIVVSEEQSQYLADTPYFSHVATLDRYKILKANNLKNSYVVPLKTQVYAISDIVKWRLTSNKWYRDYIENLSFTEFIPFIVYDPNTQESAFVKYNPKKISKIPLEKDCTAQEYVERKQIRIQTNCI
jgi:hypothetical protein